MSVREGRKSAAIVVLGVGNELLKDEGIGVHVIRCLQQMPGLDHVRLVDGGTSPDVIDLVQDAERLIIVDAIRAGDEPGAVYRLTPEQLCVQKPSSVHEVTVVDMLWRMEMLGYSPRVTIIGIEPEEIEWGMELSPVLASKLPRIVEVVLQEIKRSEEWATSCRKQRNSSDLLVQCPK